MNSSTSSSNPKKDSVWAQFFKRFVAWTLGLGLGLTALILAIDPFDTLNLSPAFNRVPITMSGRFKFPALARSDTFDSIIVGTSTSRLLRPDTLNPLFDAHFANLSMNSATAYEEYKILSLFTQHHSAAKYVLIGLDRVWCSPGETVTKYTFRPFPEWMYDENPWNDYLNHFNMFTLEQAGRQLATMTKLRPIKYGLDGYTNFLPAPEEYDLEKVRQNLYGSGPRTIQPVIPAVVVSEDERRAITFATHTMLSEALNTLPATTRKIIFFVPYHVATQPRPGSREAAQWQVCKERVADMIDDVPNGLAIDFMIESPITRAETNYWDPLHYTVEIADKLALLLHEADTNLQNSEYYS